MSKIHQNLIIILLFLLSILVIFYYFSFSPKKQFSVTFLNVGQGHATLFKTEDNIKFLIDSGKGLEAKEAIKRNISFFDKNLDICLATHFDIDHVGIFPYLTSKFDVSYFFDNGISGQKDIFKIIDKQLAKNKVVRKKLSAGNIIQINPETKIEILFPPNSININSFETNSSSLVLKITHKNSSVLITGDSPAKIEEFLVKKYGKKLKADILLAGHHGSKFSSSEIFLKTVNPEYIIFSAGKNNSYGHPNKEILDRAKKLGLKILRTDELGDIKFIYKNNKFVLKN